jgi:hypothetical protein
MPVKASIAVAFFGLVLVATLLVHGWLRRGRPGKSLSTVLTSALVFDGLSHALALSLAPNREQVLGALPISIPLLFCWGVGLVVLMDLGFRVVEKTRQPPV